MPDDVVELRTLTSRTTLIGDGRRRLEIFGSPIHYVDSARGLLSPIDPTLRWDPERNGWYLDTHGFHPTIPLYADEWATFHIPGVSDDLYIRSLCDHVAGSLQIVPDWVSTAPAVVYPNAYGLGCDLLICITAYGLKRLVRVRPEAGLNDTRRFGFEIRTDLRSALGTLRPGSEDVVPGDIVIDENRHIRPFSAWTESKLLGRVPLKVASISRSGSSLTAGVEKVLPAQMIAQALGAVTYLDDSVTYYPHTSDGVIYGYGYNTSWQASWDDAHDATSGGVSNTNAYETLSITQYESGGGYYDATIYRAFLCFDTSGLPDGATIDSATLTLRRYTYIASSGMQLVESSQSSPTSLSGTDFDNHGSTVLQSNYPDTYDSYWTFNFNSSGKALINKTGYTKLCVMLWDDYFDQPQESARDIGGTFFTAENNDPAYKPKLDITYSGGTTYSESVSLVATSSGSPGGPLSAVGSAAMASAAADQEYGIALMNGAASMIADLTVTQYGPLLAAGTSQMSAHAEEAGSSLLDAASSLAMDVSADAAIASLGEFGKAMSFGVAAGVIVSGGFLINEAMSLISDAAYSASYELLVERIIALDLIGAIDPSSANITVGISDLSLASAVQPDGTGGLIGSVAHAASSSLDGSATTAIYPYVGLGVSSAKVAIEELDAIGWHTLGLDASISCGPSGAYSVILNLACLAGYVARRHSLPKALSSGMAQCDRG